MKKYEGKNEKILKKAVCNGCGREISVKDGNVREECLSVEHLFGYFSRRDGTRVRFDLCEDCLSKLMDSFAVPAEEEEENEFI